MASRLPHLRIGEAGRVAALAIALLALLPASAPAAVAGWVTPALDLSLAGQDAQSGSFTSGPQVAVGASGDVAWAWIRSDGTNDIAQGRVRKADGTLSAVVDLSATGQDASQPDVSVDAAGNAYFTWVRWADDHSHQQAQTRARSADGTLGATDLLDTDGSHATNLHVGVSDAGVSTYVWARGTLADNVRSRTRSAGGTWTPSLASDPDDLGGGLAPDPSLDVNPSGDTTFAWTSGSAGSFVAQARRRQANGTYQPALANPADTLSGPSRFLTAPRVAVDPSGAAVFIFRVTLPSPSTNSTVESRRRARDGTTYS